MITVHKFFHGEKRLGTNRVFKLEEKGIARTNGLKQKPDKFNLEIRHKSLAVTVVNHWNHGWILHLYCFQVKIGCQSGR